MHHNLTILKLWNANWLTNEGLTLLTYHCPMLKTVELVRCGVNSLVDMCKKLVHLETLQ